MKTMTQAPTSALESLTPLRDDPEYRAECAKRDELDARYKQCMAIAAPNGVALPPVDQTKLAAKELLDGATHPNVVKLREIIKNTKEGE